MKIITINVNKGGAGKTTFAHNFAEYLKQNYRVLLLDFDDSANLTNRYGYFDKLENTVISLFEQTVARPV
ncbi:ParA family protein, partial [Pseudolactococcus yaeyamensis]